MIIIELIVPWEEIMDETNARKNKKYHDLWMSAEKKNERLGVGQYM